MADDSYYITSSNGGVNVSDVSPEQTKVRKVFDQCVQKYEQGEGLDIDKVGQCVDKSIIADQERPEGVFKLTRKGEQMIGG